MNPALVSKKIYESWNIFQKDSFNSNKFFERLIQKKSHGIIHKPCVVDVKQDVYLLTVIKVLDGTKDSD